MPERFVFEAASCFADVGFLTALVLIRVLGSRRAWYRESVGLMILLSELIFTNGLTIHSDAYD